MPTAEPAAEALLLLWRCWWLLAALPPVADAKRDETSSEVGEGECNAAQTAARVTATHTQTSDTALREASAAGLFCWHSVPAAAACAVWHSNVLNGQILPGCAAAAQRRRARGDEATRVVAVHEGAHWRVGAAEAHFCTGVASCKSLVSTGSVFCFRSLGGPGSNDGTKTPPAQNTKKARPKLVQQVRYSANTDSEHSTQLGVAEKKESVCPPADVPRRPRRW